MIPGNGEANETKAEVLRLTAQAYRRIILLLCVALAGSTAAAGFAGWSAFQVRSCTVPGGRCYKQNTVRARQSIQYLQEKADREHQIIKCVLLVQPTVRALEDQSACEAKYPVKEGP